MRRGAAASESGGAHSTLELAEACVREGLGCVREAITAASARAPRLASACAFRRLYYSHSHKTYSHFLSSRRGHARRGRGAAHRSAAFAATGAPPPHFMTSGADSYHYSLYVYPDLTRINYWARESESWRGTPDPVETRPRIFVESPTRIKERPTSLEE